jgi:hypothetical protein
MADQDFDFTLDTLPLIPEKEYEVGYVRDEKVRMWGQPKVFLRFTITEFGEYHGIELFMACNLPTGPKLSASSKLGRAWVLALGRKPDRLDRFSAKVFRGKLFYAKVRTVTKSSNQIKLTDAQKYSVIDVITKKVAG